MTTNASPLSPMATDDDELPWVRIQAESDRREDRRRRGARLILAAGKSDDAHHDQVFERELSHEDPPLEHTNPDGYTPLIVAAKNGHEKRVVRLLAAGALTTATTCDGWTALHHAVDRLHLGIVERLLEAGADPTTKVPQGSALEGRTALHLLVARAAGLHVGSPAPDAQIAGRLIAAGCNPDEPDSKGRTPWQRLQKAQGQATGRALWAMMESRALRAALDVDGSTSTIARSRPRL